jgi:hypothetical protein
MQRPLPYLLVGILYVLVEVLCIAVGVGIILMIGHGRPGFYSSLECKAYLDGLKSIAVTVGDLFFLALITLAVRQLEGKRIKVSDAFSAGSSFWRAFLYSVIVGLISLVGFVFCVIPGLIASAVFAPGVVLVLTGMDIGAALSASVAEMKPHVIGMVFLYLAVVLVYWAGICACLVGQFVTTPVVAITIALAARYLLGTPRLSGGAAPGSALPGYPTSSVDWPPPPGSY